MPRSRPYKREDQENHAVKHGKLFSFPIAVILVFFASIASFAERGDGERQDLAQDQHWKLAAPSSASYSNNPDASLMDQQSSFRLEMKQALKPNEKARLWHPLESSLTEGTTLKIRFRAKCDHETSIRFGVSRSLQDGSIIDIDPFSIGSDGRDQSRTFDMPAAKPGSYLFWFDFGMAPVKIDLSRLHLYVNHVRITEEQARAIARVAPAAVARRIDACRKGELTVLVTDKSGRIVPNASVKIEQVRHEFPFGASARSLNLSAKDAVSRSSEKSFLDLFNAVAVPFFWKEYQPTQNGPIGTLQESLLTWAKKNQLIPFAQGLVTEDDYPSWLPQTAAWMSPAIRGHILTVLKKYGDKVRTWSIYGGATNSIAGDAKSPFQAWVKTVNGLPGAIQRTLEWSRASVAGAHDLFEISEGNESLIDKGQIYEGHRPMAPPSERFAHFGRDEDGHPLGMGKGGFNRMRRYEGGRNGAGRIRKRNLDAYSEQEWEESQRPKEEFKNLIESLQSNGVQVELLGLRFNMRQQPIEATEIWKNCTLISQLQIPLQIDELAILSGEPQYGYPAPASWPSTASGEEEQARRIVEAYGVLFSNRMVRGIYYLNICDRESLNHAPYGLLRADGTQKPAYKALLNLLHHTWWTQVTGKTNDTGTFSTRAFYGDYNIVVEAKGKSTKLQFKLSSTASPSDHPIKVTLPE